MLYMLELWNQLPYILRVLVSILVVAVPLLIGVAFMVYAERKILAAMQLRQGPNMVGPFGLLQSFADALKMIGKENIIPTGANAAVFMMAPILTMVLALAAWAVIPFGILPDGTKMAVANINVGVLYLFAISSLGVYGIIMSGWASNSKYAFLGSLRSAAQMVSYEVSIGLVIITVLLCVGSLNLSAIVEKQGQWGGFWGWFFIPHFPMFILMFISGLAETNRAPFDLPEGESELVGGFHTEYSGMTFGLFFLGEYANMFLMSGMISVLFLGGWQPVVDIAPINWIPGFIWLILKICALMFIFVWVRATLPRYRYDQLMRLGWKVFLPFSLLWVILTAGVLVGFGWLPNT